MRPDMRWKYNLRGGGGWDAGLPSPVLFVPSREVWVGMCRRGHQTLTLFKTKIAHFGHFATPL